MCFDVLISKDRENGGGCAPVIVKRCVFRGGVIALKESCQVFSKGAEGVVGKEEGVGEGDMGMQILKPGQTCERDGSGEGAVRSI